MTGPILRLTLITAALLLVPAIAMQFSDEIAWGSEDFLAMGALLFGTGLAYLLLTRTFPRRAHRMAAGAGLAVLFLAVWAELAVGIF